MVGVRGFEPPAPASRTQCSTRLSYTPTHENGAMNPGRELLGEGVYTDPASLRQALLDLPAQARPFPPKIPEIQRFAASSECWMRRQCGADPRPPRGGLFAKP